MTIIIKDFVRKHGAIKFCHEGAFKECKNSSSDKFLRVEIEWNWPELELEFEKNRNDHMFAHVC